jgi:hypothetical protein
MSSNTPPNSGQPQPVPQPLSSQILQVANPFTEGIYAVGGDIIQKNQTPPKPPGQ